MNSSQQSWPKFWDSFLENLFHWQPCNSSVTQSALFHYSFRCFQCFFSGNGARTAAEAHHAAPPAGLRGFAELFSSTRELHCSASHIEALGSPSRDGPCCAVGCVWMLDTSSDAMEPEQVRWVGARVVCVCVFSVGLSMFMMVGLVGSWPMMTAHGKSIVARCPPVDQGRGSLLLGLVLAHSGCSSRGLGPHGLRSDRMGWHHGMRPRWWT